MASTAAAACLASQMASTAAAVYLASCSLPLLASFSGTSQPVLAARAPSGMPTPWQGTRLHAGYAVDVACRQLTTSSRFHLPTCRSS